MGQEPPVIHRGTHRVSIDAEAIANDLIATAKADIVERGETEPLAVVDEAVTDLISGHRIEAKEWFEAMYLIEWLTAEYALHPTALTAHVVEGASSPAFGSIIDQLVDTALRHLVRQEVLDEDLSRGLLGCFCCGQ